MSSKPFELRASLLSQAEQILMHQFHQDNEKTRYLCDRDLIDPKTTSWPMPPKTEDILKEAEKLYSFIKKK